MSDQKRIEEAAAWAKSEEGRAELDKMRKKLEAYASEKYAISPEDLYSPLGLEKKGECKNCEQLLARIAELEECLHDLGGAVHRLIDKGYLTTFDEHDEAECDHLSDVAQAAMEHAQKLLFSKEQPKPPNKDLLGFWRAKTTLPSLLYRSEIVDLPAGKKIEVIGFDTRGRGGVLIKFDEEFQDWLWVGWLKDNFEKVEEGGV